MAKSKTKKQPKLGPEIATLAKQVMAVIKDPVVHSQVKGIGKTAVSGLRATSGRIVKALQQARESRRTAQIKSQAKRVVGIGSRKAEKQAKAAARQLTKNLHAASAELQKLAKKIQKKG